MIKVGHRNLQYHTWLDVREERWHELVRREVDGEGVNGLARRHRGKVAQGVLVVLILIVLVL